MTDDSFFVGRHYVRCDFGNVQKSMFACIDHIKQVASTVGMFFTNSTTQDYYRYLIDTYEDATLTLVISQLQVSLEVNPRASAICTIDPENVAQDPDPFTTVMQTKFWNHLSGAYSSLIDMYYLTGQNLQHMFSLITDTKTSGDYVDKATKDICKSNPPPLPWLTNKRYNFYLNTFNTFSYKGKDVPMGVNICINVGA